MVGLNTSQGTKFPLFETVVRTGFAIVSQIMGLSPISANWSSQLLINRKYRFRCSKGHKINPIQVSLKFLLIFSSFASFS